jgi:hypothetical protein
MFSASFRRLIALLNRSHLPTSRSAAAPRKRGFRPQLEFLEGRIAPAVDMWTGANFAVNNNWSNGANWSLGHAPGAGDVALFTSNSSVKSSTSVVDSNYTIAGLQIDGSWGGTINVPGTLTLATGSTNEFDSGSLNPAVTGGSVVNNGTLTLNGTGNVVLGGGGTLTNNGTIDQHGTGSLALAGTTNVATTLVNAAGATYNFQANSSIVYGGGAGGAVTNAGLIEKTGGTGTSAIAQTLTNNGGTLNAASGTLGIAANSTNAKGTFTAAAGAIFDLTDGQGYTFTENGTFTGSGAGVISLNNGDLAVGTGGATFNIPATLAFQWSGGTISVPVNATLAYNGILTQDSSTGVALTGGGTFQNNGTINQTSTGNLDIAGTGSVVTTLSNTAKATYNLQADSGIAYGGGAGGVVSNAGLIEKTAGSGASAIAQTLINIGTLDAAAGTLAIAANSNNTNGTYQVAAGAILDLTDGQGYTFTENGTFTGSGAGAIVLSNGTLAASSSGATFNIPATLSFIWSGGVISVPVHVTLAYNGTLTQNSSSGVTLTGGGTFQNNGTINQTGSGNLDIAGTSSVVTTLSNTAKATYNFQADSGIAYGGGAGGVVSNTGLIEKTAGTGTSFFGQPLQNTGTLNVATGTLRLANNSTNSNGTYQVAAGATLDLTGGNAFSETGNFTATGAGTITLGGGTFSVCNGAATLTIPSTIAFQWPGGAINVPVNETLTVNGNLVFDGSNNELLEGGGTLTENGTITQSGTGSLLMAGTSNVATTLVLPKGSVYDFASNSGIGYGGGQGGVVTSAGTIEKTAGGATSAIGVAFNNSGILTVQTGTLSLATTGGENTGGVFNVSSGAILDLTGGNNVAYTGTYTGSGSGEVLLRGGILNVSGGTNGATFNLPGNLFVWSGGAIDTAANNNLTVLGNLKLSGATNEVLQGGGSLNIGTTTSAGTLNDTGTGNTLTLALGSTLNVSSKSTFNIADDTINGIGLLSNFGSLVKTAGTSGATVVAIMDNQGKVQVNDGTLLFSGPVDQVFNGVLTGGSWTAVGSSTVASTLDISSANFSTIGLGASVTLNGPNSSFSNLSNLSVNQGSFSLLGGQSFATAGNFTNSGSLTLSPGSVLTVNGSFTESSGGTDNVQLSGTSSSPTFGSIVATGKVSLAGALNVTSTVTPSVGSSFDILGNQGSSPIGGAFAGLPEGSTFTVKVGSTTMTFKITYKGGASGKDVVITRIS